MNNNHRRKDPRTEATRKALIEAAEELFGRYGFDAVTMKEIGTAIGSRNKVVVAYHFGSKSELVDAIYGERLPQVEARRAELLLQVCAKGQEEDLEALLIALWQPLAEIRNSSGVRSYALFLGAMLRQGMDHTRRIVHEASPATRAIVDRIVPFLPRDVGAMRDLRWQLATNLVLEAIRLFPEADRTTFERAFDEAVAMGMAALVAPSRRTPTND